MRAKNNKVEQTDFWKGHSLSWKKSGLTQQAYCEQSGISYRSFVYQHNRLSSQTKPSSIDVV